MFATGLPRRRRRRRRRRFRLVFFHSHRLILCFAPSRSPSWSVVVVVVAKVFFFFFFFFFFFVVVFLLGVVSVVVSRNRRFVVLSHASQAFVRAEHRPVQSLLLSRRRIPIKRHIKMMMSFQFVSKNRRQSKLLPKSFSSPLRSRSIVFWGRRRVASSSSSPSSSSSSSLVKKKEATLTRQQNTNDTTTRSLSLLCVQCMSA